MKFILYLLVAALLSACSDYSYTPTAKTETPKEPSRTLTREAAKAAIMAKYHYPLRMYNEVGKSYLISSNTNGFGVTVDLGTKYEDVKGMLDFFQAKGLITLKEETRIDSGQTAYGTTVRTWNIMNVILTPQGEKYHLNDSNGMYRVVVWQRNILAVTGIVENDQILQAAAEYTVGNDMITPFGEYYDYKGKVEALSQQFVRFDDGWRAR